MLWQDSEEICKTLEVAFSTILQTRMRDVAVVNPALSVQALGFDRYRQDWLGVLITPWFMNLLLLPGEHSSWSGQARGSKFSQVFPYGEFEFVMAEEEQLGPYAQCSLFSPMFQFAEQPAAVTAAQSALQGLLTEPAPRTVSRRDLLRVRLGAGNV